MQVWKRRLVALVAVGVGSVGLMSTAGAQTPPEFPEIPGFSIPDFSIPDFTIPSTPTVPPSTTVTTGPPPTMPATTVTTGPPPTMPPTSFPLPSFPPPTMPPTSIPPAVDLPDLPDEILEEVFQDLFDRFDDGGQTFDELRAILDDIIASF